MLFGEGPQIKNISADLNKLFRQGSLLNQSVQNVEGDSTADQGTSDLLAARDPVIQEISVGMSGEQSARYTVSGTPPLSLPNSLGKPLKAWSVDVLPKQDLNGYDAPWPAGGGVNKLLFSNSDMSETKNGITASYNATTGLFTVTGTETYGSAFAVLVSENAFKLPNFVAGETYTISKTQVTGELTRSIYVQISYRRTSGTNNALVLNDKASTTFTVPSDFDYAYNVFVGVYAGASNLNNAFKIQLESGSTATEWTPYSNICPILGTDKLNMFVEESYDQSATPKAVITLPSTVYNGTVGSDGGESRWGKIVLDGSETWGGSGAHGMYTQVDTLVKRTSRYTNSMMCDILSVKTNHSSTTFTNSEYAITGFGNMAYPNQNWIYVTAAGITTTAELKVWLAENPVTVVYELATPTTFSVPSVTIPTPKGSATTWAMAEDGTVDSMEVTYVGEA